jgi:hypothetical protein
MDHTATSPEALASASIVRYEAGETTYPAFVLELEDAVAVAEEVHDQRARELRRLWGQLEIINALHTDNSWSPTDTERKDITELIAAIRQLCHLPGDREGEQHGQQHAHLDT